MMKLATLAVVVACFSSEVMAFSTLCIPQTSARRSVSAPALRLVPNVGKCSARPSSCWLRMAEQTAGDKNAQITLGQYKGLQIKVQKQAPTEAEITKVLKDYAKDYSLVSARFTDGQGGARMGHTVLINFKGFDAKTNAEVKGTAANMYELELKEGHKEPWKSFTQAISVGMGQDEMKSFTVDLPEDYAVAALKGKQLRFECYVKQIKQKVPKAPDARPEADQRKAAIAELNVKYDKVNQEAADKAIREQIFRTCKADTSKAENAVSWAKFGEKSGADFQFQLIKEAIGKAEGIKEIDEVEKFLRDSAQIEWV